MPDDTAIRIWRITEADWPAVWEIIEPVFRAGETYAFARDITADEAHRAWVELPCATFVAAQHDGEILGTLPQAFEHPRHGYVDAYVMHKALEANRTP